MSDAWTDSVRRSSSIGELLDMARKYVASWDAARIQALPPECRPVPIVTSDDLSAYALTLVRNRMSPEGEAGSGDVEQLGHFFTTAAMRLAEIIALSRGLSSSRAYLRPLEVDEP